MDELMIFWVCSRVVKSWDGSKAVIECVDVFKISHVVN